MASQLSTTHAETVEYRNWRLELARSRLRIGFWLAIVGNPTYVALDFLLYPSNALHFLLVRTVLELAMIAGLLLTYTRPTETRQLVQFLIFVWGICFPVAYMTTAIGGFRSTYYAGMTLLIFGSAVLVPVRWRLHVVSQAGVLVFYYAVNLLGEPASGDLGPAIETSYFLVWTCILSAISVFLYERLLSDEFNARTQLEASNHKLLELDRLKTQFFANISHELRTPLTLIVGAFRSLMSGSGSIAADALAAVRAGLRNSVNLLYLINELLDLSRFESGRMQSEMQPLDMASLVRQVSANFEHSVPQRIHMHGVAEVQVVRGNPKLLKKVIYNLFSNAVKFSDPDSGEVWVRMRSTTDSVLIDVEDNGVGIAPENLSRIFDRFTQVEGSANRRYEGSGIGLALVKEIVTQHGGTINVESVLGKGSTFSVTLRRSDLPPVDLMSDEEALPSGPGQAKEIVHEQHAFSHAGALVLVADDNPDMRQYLRRILEPHFRVLLASDGREALELAKSQKPDLVLTDIMMPNASGYELLANLRNEKELREVPVVFLTALSASESRIAALETSADDIIGKPFEEEELVVRLRNILGTRRQQRELAQLRIERLRRFLPGPVASALIEKGSDEALRSHRGEVTVVFFDLRGFTAFSEEAEPEELMEMLRDYQTRIGALVDQYGGTLEHFSGDAIMVFFNDPLPVPNHPHRAVCMAVAARAVLPAFEERWRKRGFTLGIGVGAAIGYATMGMIGYERRQDYAAIGPVTIVAARLCERADSGQVLISETLANIIKETAALVSVGALRLHGIRAPVNAYNVIDIQSQSGYADN